MSGATALMPSYAVAEWRQGQALASSPAIVATEYHAQTIVEQALEVDVPAQDCHILVIARDSRSVQWTDLDGRKPSMAFRRGEALLIPAGCSSWWSSSKGRGEVLHVHLRRGTLDRAKAGAESWADPAPLLPFSDGLVAEIADALTRAMTDEGPQSALHHDALGLVLCHRLNEIIGRVQTAGTDRARGLAPWQLSRVCDRMTDELTVEPSLVELATLIGLSPEHFCRAFRISTGLPPHRWLIRHRIEQARALLVDTGLPVADVAARTGFADPSYFAKSFKHATGETPLAYRRERLA